MVEQYRQDLQEIVDRFEAAREEPAGIECRHFFSGAAAYAEGRIFMSLSPAGLALKLPTAEREKLRAAGAGSLRYFPEAPVKKGYVVLPDEIAGDPEALAPLIEKAIGHTLGNRDD